MTTLTPSAPPDRKALIFIIITVVLNAMGLTLIIPIAPFLVSRYVSDPNSIGIAVAALTSVYAVCQFIAAPGLGALSDRFGRRPILLICLLGSAVGYLLLGFGGALWVLLLGRAIDGLTGANNAVINAYLADIVPPAERARYYGMVGALASVSIVIGPAVGGLIAQFGYEVPFYLAAVVAFINLLIGFFFMPESLPRERRTASISPAKLNPITTLRDVLAMPQLRWMLVAIFVYNLVFLALPSNVSLYIKDTLNWGTAEVGPLFSVLGVVSIISQAAVLPFLLKRIGTSWVAVSGILICGIGFVVLALVSISHSALMIYVSVGILALGEGLVSPSLTELVSRGADASSQGRVQGGSQSVSSLANIGGPLIVGVTLRQSGTRLALYRRGDRIARRSRPAFAGAARHQSLHSRSRIRSRLNPFGLAIFRRVIIIGGNAKLDDLKRNLTMPNRNVLLVGSMPFDNEEAAMKRALDALGPLLFSLPDGEVGEKSEAFPTGLRSSWVNLAIEKLYDDKSSWRTLREPVRNETGFPADYGSFQHLEGLRPPDEMSEHVVFGYDEFFKSSYPIFQRERSARGLNGLKFQLGIPTGSALGFAFPTPQDAAPYLGTFNSVLAREVNRAIAAAGDDVIIQIEIPPELYAAYMMPQMMDQLAVGPILDLLSKITPGANIGMHLCLGDFHNESINHPDTLNTMVEFSNRLVDAWPQDKKLVYMHYPFAEGSVPPSIETGHYAPLKNIHLPDGVHFIAGFVHEKRSLAELRGILSEIEAARGAAVDVACSCGLGRRSPAVADQLFGLLAQVAQTN